MSKSLFASIVTASVDWLACGVMRTGSIFLTRRIRLDALSSAIRWVMKQQNNQPLHISHESAYGDLSLMSDGDLIQLTWQLIGQKPSDAKAKPSGENDTGPVKKALTEDQNLKSNHETHDPGKRKSLKDKI